MENTLERLATVDLSSLEAGGTSTLFEDLPAHNTEHNYIERRTSERRS